jgi:hypothetical protein
MILNDDLGPEAELNATFRIYTAISTCRLSLLQPGSFKQLYFPASTYLYQLSYCRTLLSLRSPDVLYYQHVREDRTWCSQFKLVKLYLTQAEPRKLLTISMEVRDTDYQYEAPTVSIETLTEHRK